MSKAIYQLELGNSNVSGFKMWKDLGAEEAQRLDAARVTAFKAVGGEVILSQNSAFADSMHRWWSISRFPSLQDCISFTHAAYKTGYLDVSDQFTLLGTMEDEVKKVDLANPIYCLWIIKNTVASAQSIHQAGGSATLAWEEHNQLYQDNHSQIILYCSSYWANQAYQGFGVSVFPDIDALMRVSDGLEKLGWPKYFDAVTYLGIPWSEE